MGTCSSKSAGKRAGDAPVLPTSQSVKEIMSSSIHSLHEADTTRQKLTWWREDTPVDEVYEVMENIGQGSMGEVAICQKKVDSSEKVDARTQSLTALSERDDDETVQIAAEIAQTLNAQYHAAGGKTKERRRYACKTLNTMWMKNSDIMEYLNEIDILRDLDHPNIVTLYEVYSVKRKIWLIMELCTGGDLTTRAANMTEPDVVIVLEQILMAIKYMHKRNVCHRDLKLENILYSDESPSAQIKLIDFGLSNKFTKGRKMMAACGTVYTAAPEMLNGEGYTEQTDLWSIGVIAFILLSSGSYPFLRGSEDLEDEAKKQRLADAKFKFAREWDERNISRAARDFVLHSFQKDPINRWSAAEALEFLQNGWIPHLESMDQCSETIPEEMPKAMLEKEVTFDEATEIPSTPIQVPPSPKSNRETLTRSVGSKRSLKRMDSSMIAGIKKYVEYSELKKTILMTMAYTLDKSSLHELRDMFVVLDTQGSGTVTLVDLKKSLQQMHSDTQMDDATIEKLFRGIDVDCSGQIHWNEFLAAVVESQGLITMGALGEAFDRIDSKGKGYISRDDLKKILGNKYQEDEVNSMLDEADYKKNGQIDYSEFLRLMFDDPEKGMSTLGTSFHALDQFPTSRRFSQRSDSEIGDDVAPSASSTK